MDYEWMEYAKCKGRTDIDFFPETGHHGNEALEFCQGCRVRRRCFEYALKHKVDEGVWGGVSANRRNLYRRKMARSS